MTNTVQPSFSEKMMQAMAAKTSPIWTYGPVQRFNNVVSAGIIPDPIKNLFVLLAEANLKAEIIYDKSVLANGESGYKSPECSEVCTNAMLALIGILEQVKITYPDECSKHCYFQILQNWEIYFLTDEPDADTQSNLFQIPKGKN